MNRKNLIVGLALALLLILSLVGTALARIPSADPEASMLADGLEGGSGSAIGPGGALFVTESVAGRFSRIDPDSGDVTTFAEGLPPSILDLGVVQLGGAVDLDFIGDTAYVLVTGVGSDAGGSDTVGIYRVDGFDSFTVIADIGQWSIDNPSPSDVMLPTGVQYAMHTFRGGFLVTDGHHNRVLWVSTDGEITEVIGFGNIVPTGLATHGQDIYMSETGPIPHLPEDGKVVVFGPKSSAAKEVAFGAPMMVDVEFGRGRTLFALSQGDFPDDGFPAAPAEPDTGALLKVNQDGSLDTIMAELDRPTSLEIIGNTAYVVTLDGEIWKIDNIANPPYRSTGAPSVAAES